MLDEFVSQLGSVCNFTFFALCIYIWFENRITHPQPALCNILSKALRNPANQKVQWLEIVRNLAKTSESNKDSSKRMKWTENISALKHTSLQTRNYSPAQVCADMRDDVDLLYRARIRDRPHWLYTTETFAMRCTIRNNLKLPARTLSANCARQRTTNQRRIVRLPIEYLTSAMMLNCSSAQICLLVRSNAKLRKHLLYHAW